MVIASSTRRLAGGLFEYRDLGRVALKGLADPIQAWQVLAASAVQSRFEAQHETSLAPLVGREEELELLLRRWNQACWAMVVWLCLLACRASENRDGLLRSRSDSNLGRMYEYATSARHNTVTAPYIQSSISSNAPLGLNVAMHPRRSYTSSKPYLHQLSLSKPRK